MLRFLEQAAAAAQDSGVQWGFPENVSTHGDRIDSLFWLMTAVTAPFLVGITLFILYCLVRFRRRERRPAAHILGFRSALGTTILAVGLLFIELPIDFYQEDVWAQSTVRFPDSSEAVVVQVYAEQFAWNFRYPGKDGKFGTADDVTTINNLHAPVGKPVICVMRARDVIHSFWLPHFRVKMDVMPGLTHRVWFQATREGTFEIACAELCGLGHYRMRALLHALPPGKFQAKMGALQKELEEDGPGDEAAKWKLWDKQP
jgi:cytochrome c oxidase subunit 2